LTTNYEESLSKLSSNVISLSVNAPCGGMLIFKSVLAQGCASPSDQGWCKASFKNQHTATR